MSYTDGVIVFLGLSMLLYFILGGADFGAGILEMIIGDRSISTIDRAIAPIWEANHMWLIIVVVILFNGFPEVYALLSTALHIPIMLVLVGLILRGTAFTFRHYDAIQDRSQVLYSHVFRYSSAFTVFCLGLIASPIIIGSIPADMSVGFYAYFIAPWFNLFSFNLGLFLLCLSAYIAAIYLLGEVKTPEGYATIAKAVQRLFIASFTSGILLFVLSSIQGLEFHHDFASNEGSLTTIVLASALIPFVFYLIKKRMVWAMRIAVTVQMTLIFLGLVFIHSPNLVKSSSSASLNLYANSAPEAVLSILFWSLLIGLCLVIPCLVYLIWVFKMRPNSIKPSH